ncbi:variant erythrocyte surface antigen-1 family protein [Babesia caballi]|uniref:Variant erythrocyte surface antigen-1 family protein n=1 Tax=Babesia caballi TaxID=5871 RepID=A0AAV4LWM9_BABCB|nr:variant erythrocyte surface antigen-1 family protein [Babesia caballi]
MIAMQVSEQGTRVRLISRFDLVLVGVNVGGDAVQEANPNPVARKLERCHRLVFAGRAKDVSTADRSEVLTNAVEKLTGSDVVTKSLSNGDLGGLFKKVAEGLQTFIGYNGQTGGKIKAEVGIAVSNLPVERLRDAVLMFIAPFLGVLRYHHPELTKDPKLTAPFNKAVEACKNGVGCGREGFEKALAEVQKELGQVKNTPIQQVVNAVKNVSAMKRNQNFLSTFATKVKEYFNNVLEKAAEDGKVSSAGNVKTHIETLKSNLATLVINVPLGKQQSLKTYIDTIYQANTGALSKLRSAFPRANQYPKAYALSAATHTATTAFVTVLQTDYTSYYKGVTWTSGQDTEAKCAKIFLACLPLIFNGLNYFYWKCSSNGGWKTMTLGSPEPKAFMGLMSIGVNRVKSGRKGEDVLNKAFEKFNEFQTAANGSTTSYADFLKKFRSTGIETWKMSHTATASNFLSGLYLCSTSYFRHQHQKRAATARPPSSIREMLYWLMGLTATPQFGDLLGHIHNIVGNNFSVAVSGSPKTGETLSPDQVTSYILSTCYTAPSVLNVIEGRVPPEEIQNDPWLHELYSNSAFPFQYPSGAALLYALSEYTYSLQFQLSFLYKQCEYSYEDGCGWHICRYGSDTLPNGSGNAVTSHLCEGFKCGEKHLTCKHDGSGNSTTCKHDQGGQAAQCGKAPNNSPLQAFLTDKLPGFSLPTATNKLTYSDGHLASCSGSLCHVPMGFKAEDLRSEPKNNTKGSHISVTLEAFCGGFNTPLRQLCEKLGCLTKRTPRSLGDLFGFIWHLNGQLFNKTNLIGSIKSAIDEKPKSLEDFIGKIKAALNKVTPQSSPQDSGLESALVSMASSIPFLYQFLTVNADVSLPVTLFNLKGNVHGTSSGDHNDLYSLYYPQCPGTNCGPYLYPLTHTDGAAYVPVIASAYLSWLLYLTDDFEAGLRDMLERFKGLECTKYKTSCHSDSTGSASCTCPSIVECSGVLPLLYSNGFNFANASMLKGAGGQSSKKKTCDKFHTQLSNILKPEAPLHNLLLSIDEFLYMFRIYFFYNLSSFWLCSLIILLYFIFYGIDVLHLQSHAHFPSSHIMPPIGLLTTGKVPALTKLTYYMP